MSGSVLPPSSCYISGFGFGDSAGIMKRKKHSRCCESLRHVGPGCSSFLPCLEVGCGQQRLHQTAFLHLSFRRSSWLLLAPLLAPPVPVVTAPPCSLCPKGAHRFQWIRNLVPEFGISSSHVKVLSSPAEFYELLKVSCGFHVVGMVSGAGSCSGLENPRQGVRKEHLQVARPGLCLKQGFVSARSVRPALSS